MLTRAAASRAALFGGQESLSSPPATPDAAQGNTRKYKQSPDLEENAALGTGVGDIPILSSSINAKRKRTVRGKKHTEPVSGAWDILPHGLGKAGDLAKGSVIDQATTESPLDPPQKRARRGKAIKNEEDLMLEGGDKQIKTDVKEENIDEVGKTSTLDVRVGRRYQENSDPFTPDSMVTNEYTTAVSTSGKISKSTRKKKTNKYGLTPGFSPFPDHIMPTPEACEEVNRLLSELHGEVKPPDEIPPPSMEVTGCGEVPDLLDAILRTLLSAATTANNSNMALKGLKDRFGLRTSGIGQGSVNWEAVHQADLPTIADSIKKGGLAQMKAANIKKILDAVYGRNCVRREALLKERETGEPSKITGAETETQLAKDAELARSNETMLSMDYVFEMTTDEAMEEMTKLPGIGVKTASCVILFCMKRPSFAVDTHVWRHCKWLGWVPQKATRDQTFSHCEVRVPDHLKYPLHQLFLRHGKTCGHCRANTSAGTEEWEKTVCPIEHLVTRNEKRKITGASISGATKKKVMKRKKGKKYDDTEESEAEIEEESSGYESD